MNRSTPGLPVHHQLPENTQTHVHRVDDAIQPSHSLSSPSPPAVNLQLRLKLKLQYFDHLMWKADSLEKTLMLRKPEDRKRSGGQRMRWWMASPTQWTWVLANSRRQWRTGKPGLPQSCKELGSTERLNSSNNFIMRLNYGRWNQERRQNVKLQSLSLHLDHSCTSRNWPTGGRYPARSQREWWVRS